MKTALITGASTGIGYDLAHCFAREGFDLVVVARNQEKLARLAGELNQKYGISVTVLAKDLSFPVAPAEIFIDLREKEISVDVLVNNAGFGSHGAFAETDLATEMEMMQVNMVSLVELTKLFMREMLKRGEGKILNVASTAAFAPGGPLMSIYYATKAFVLSFSEALSEELRGTGVTVTCLCPGATKTEFQERAGIQRIWLLRGGMLDSKAVAEAGVRGLMKGKRLVVPSLRSKLQVLLIKFSPRRLVTLVVKWVQMKIGEPGIKTEKTSRSGGGSS